jgi:hypothetical protein
MPFRGARKAHAAPDKGQRDNEERAQLSRPNGPPQRNRSRPKDRVVERGLTKEPRPKRVGNLRLTFLMCEQKICDDPLKFFPTCWIFWCRHRGGRDALGVLRRESGAGRCPEPARIHLAPRRIWL